MKIAVDYQSASGRKTGIGVAAENLVQAMRQESPDIEWLLYQSGRDDLNTPDRILWESFEVPRRTKRDRPDLLYSPGFAPPILGNVPAIVTVHDLIGMAFPQNQAPFSRFYWSTWLPAAVRRARRVVASSESTRRDIERFLKIPAERVEVVPLGVDGAFRKEDNKPGVSERLDRLGVTKPFFISVSSLEPRKNHLRLLQAYLLLKKKNKAPFNLVIVGKPAGAHEALAAFVKENSLEKDVRILGYARQEELVALYHGAMGYVMISLYEGFGLPVLEAMSCGLSGVCSDRTSLPEVAGETALLVDPEDVSGIATALERYSGDAALRASLSEAAHKRSKLFSTAVCARHMIRIFKNEAQR